MVSRKQLVAVTVAALCLRGVTSCADDGNILGERSGRESGGESSGGTSGRGEGGSVAGIAGSGSGNGGSATGGTSAGSDNGGASGGGAAGRGGEGGPGIDAGSGAGGGAGSSIAGNGGANAGAGGGSGAGGLSGNGGASGSAGAGPSCASENCGTGEFCIGYRTIGGVAFPPDDAGACDPGYHAEGQYCMPDFRYLCSEPLACPARPPGCDCLERACPGEYPFCREPTAPGLDPDARVVCEQFAP